MRAVPLAKITRPEFSGVFPRERLFTLLDTGLRRPAVWISGPPGSGKTILVSSYIESRALPCLWYQVDCGDADAATFFYYMGLAAKKAVPRSRRPLLLFTPEYALGLPAFSRRYFEDLFGRLKTPFCLIFDNYQDVSDSTPFHEIIRHSVEVIPAGVHIIFLSRYEPPQPLVRMQANSMEALGWDDLALTPEESREITCLKLERRLSRKLTQDFYSKTSGWAMGLALMIEKAKKGVFDTKQLKAVVMDTVFDYFHSEVLAKLNADTRNFLLKTAILPAMDAHMAKRLTGIDHAGRILSSLNRNNYFIDGRFQHHHHEAVYQYHQLFREFLLYEAKDSFTPEELSLLWKQAALILSESGRFEDAFVLFRDSSEWEGIAGLVMENAAALVRQGRGRVLEEWIASLPPEMLDNRPWLQYWLGVCRLTFNPGDGRAWLEKAFLLFKEQGDAAGVYMSWSGVIDCLVCGLDNLRTIDHWIPLLDEMMRSFGGFPSEETEACAASSMFTALVHRQPQHPEIDFWRSRALEIAHRCRDIGVKARILSNDAFHKMNSGLLEEAAIAIDSFRRLTQSGNTPPLAVLQMKWIEAMYLTYTASHEKCMKVVSDGLSLSASTGVYAIDFLLMGQGALSALDAGDFQAAGRLLEKMVHSSDAASLRDKGYHRYLLAYNALLRKDLKQAAMHAETALRQSQNTGFPLAESLCRLENAHVMHELGRYQKASSHLNSGRKTGRLINYKYVEFISLLTSALFAFDRGKEKSGLASLRKAMALGRECGYVNTYTLRPDAVARLCCKALEAGIETEYVRNLIRKRNLLAGAPPLDIEGWPWPIKVFTLGRFVVAKEGKALRFHKKARQKPLSMLKALIALGGREISKDQIMDILWPESEGDLAHRAFKSTLYRLRTIAGIEKAISFKGNKITLDAHSFWVDTWAFERILGKADAALRESDKEKAIHLIEKAVSLYQGPFLSGEEVAPWDAAIRKRLRSKFIRYAGELGHLYEEKGEQKKAIHAFKRGIEADALAEEFYRHLMTCYLSLGRRAEALAVYNDLKRTLSAILGVGPSPQTEALYRRIMMEREGR